MKQIAYEASALMVIDLQRYFVERGAPAFLARAPEIVPRVCALVEAFRRAGRPIVFTRHAHRRGTPTGQMGRWWDEKLPWEGDPISALITDLVPAKDDLLVTKTRYSAFEGTELAAQLSSRGVTTIVLCGVMTNLCVETNARHAFMKDFQPVVVEDACAANSDAHHRASILNLSYGFAPIVTTDELLASLAR